METLELESASPREMGRAHGEHFRSGVRALAEIRIELALSMGRFGSRERVLEVAAEHLPLLERWDASLHAELVGIAEGAALGLAEVVVLNHYTDLKDIEAENCTSAAVLPAEGPLVAQTWDMHGSAEPFVCMLRIPATDGKPAAWVFTLTGCLALAGMNDRGLGVTINNLKSRDARVGVVWPALVRRMLAESGTRGAKHVLMTAPMSSGHHYLFGDAEEVCGIETSGERKAVVFEASFAEEPGASFTHANHCLSPAIDEVSWVAEWSTSHDRYAWITSSLEATPVEHRDDLWRRLGSHEGYPRSLCTHLASEERPHAMKTCGAVLIDPRRRELWATQGCVHEKAPSTFGFDS